MRIGEIIQITVIGGALLGGVAVAINNAMGPGEEYVVVDVEVPNLSPAALEGERVFNNNCVACHGQSGSGTQLGPPLVHDIYNPGHHGDQSFYRAAQKGVKQHHWPYGNMPPQPQVAQNDMSSVIEYVRELQKANGIYARKHRM